MTPKLTIVKTLAELQSLEQHISKYEFVAYDCETTGLDKEAEMIGFSVCVDFEEAFYVVIARWDVPTQQLVYLETKEGTAAFLRSLMGKSLLMHNAVFDCWKAETNYGVKLMPSLHTDTMILAHLLDENRHVGLKELGVSIFGQDAKKEQVEMKESVSKNGGVLTRANYELYKADCDLIGKYGAKDTLLTFMLFYHLGPQLYEQELDKFFYEEECMPLLKGPTYELNTVGLKIAPDQLQKLKCELEAECMEAKAFVHKEIESYVKHKYPAKTKKDVFNIGSSKQLSWLLFFNLGNEFVTLTKGGRELCKTINYPIPYSSKAKIEFLKMLKERKDEVYQEATFNPKTKKMGRPKKLEEPWNYIACDKEVLKKFSSKYKWVERLLEYSKNLKLLNTYVEGIQTRNQYGIIRPSFLQHGTTSGRYSSRNPNFQNLPRKDKRVKSCIVTRPGKVMVGADYSQLEPRVFASYSQDERLMNCFSKGEDFYSVIGTEVFGKKDCSLIKDEPESFALKYPDLRDTSKAVALSATYGTTAFKMAPLIGTKADEAQDIIDKYFINFPRVRKFMLSCHKTVKEEGRVVNLFGRPRRLPEGLEIQKVYHEAEHSELPYNVRNILNLAVNHTIQSTGASIMNRAAIACYKTCRDLESLDPAWAEVKLILQVHDELVLEGPEHLADEMVQVLKHCMENTVTLPGVSLVAEPKVGKSLSELK